MSNPFPRTLSNSLLNSSNCKKQISKATFIITVLFSVDTSQASLPAGVNEYAQERGFHAKLKQAHPELLQDGAQSYYKKITPVTSIPNAGCDQWHFPNVSISGNKIDPDMNGVYTYEGIPFTINPPVDFDANQALDMIVGHDEIPINVQLTKVVEKKVPALTRFESYDDVLNAARDNKLSLIHEVTLKGILRTPEGKAFRVSVEGENERNYPITIRGMEVVYKKDEGITKIFFDFADDNNESVDCSFPIECKHKAVAFKNVVCVKEHRLYDCNGKNICGFFDSPEIRNMWIPDETGFYDLDRHVLTSLPSCYSNPDDHQETPIEPIVWIFGEGYNSFYQLDSAGDLEDTNNYFYSAGGALFATLRYKATLKEYLSNQNRIELNYLSQVANPSLSVHKDASIVGGHRDWPTGIWQRMCVGDRTSWQRVEGPVVDPIKFRNKILCQDGLNANWSKSEALDAKQSKRWCDAAQRLFTSSFQAKINRCNKGVSDGFGTWNKLTSLDLSHVQLEDGLQWNDTLAAISSMEQLTKLHFKNNSPIADFAENYELLVNRSSDYYLALGACLGKLTKLKELHLQGLWLNPHRFLGTGCDTSASGITSVSREVATLTGVIKHEKQAGVSAIIKSICALNHLENLSIDGIVNHGSSDPFQIADANGQGAALKDLTAASADQLAQMPSLNTISVYSPGGNCIDYFSKDFKEDLVASRLATVPALPALTINSEVLS